MIPSSKVKPSLLRMRGRARTGWHRVSFTAPDTTMAQQYGYGYGQYPAYGYGQQHAVGYSMQPMQYGQQRAPYSGQQVPYNTHNASMQAQKPAQSSVAPPPPPPGANQAASTFYSAPGNQSNQQQSPQQLPPQHPQQTTPTHPTHHSSQQQSPGYYGYQAFRPSAPHSYQSSYYQQHQGSSSTPSSHSGNVGYPIPTSSSAGSASYSSSGYASAANTYYRQKQNQPPHSKPPGQPPGGHGGPPQKSGGLYTPQQQKVIEQYIQQKQQGSSPAPGGPGGPGGFQRKKPFSFVPQQQQPVYYCETCKISCASAATYKTHLEGKLHKKKQEQKSAGISAATTPQGGYFCQLCDVICTGKDAFEAHIKGAKHQKVVTLHRRLGKPIPEVKMPTITNTTGAKAAANIAQKEGKTVQVAAPRITFVGGQKLTSTGQSSVKEPMKVYPPGAAVSSVGEGGAAAEGKDKAKEGGQVKTEGVAGTTAGAGDGSAAAGAEEAEPEPVGEHLVVTAQNDPNFPHARYKCVMCDCFFNDEYAKRMHVKGRRHRLNFKKTYQPDLYVEPTKQQKRDQEKRRKSVELRRRQRGAMVGGSPGAGPQGAGPDVNELRRQEAAEIAKMYNHRPGGQIPGPPEEFVPDPYYYGEEFWGWEGEPFAGPPLPPRNPRDDKLVLNKHGAIHPTEAEVTAVQHVVADTEKALKLISDDLLADKCKDQGATPVKEETEVGKEMSKEESLRDLKGVMRVGAFAQGLLLKGECYVELVLMCAEKPTLNLFNTIAGQLPAKFESLQSDNVYNVTPEPGRSELIIISQVEDYRVQINLTFTSTQMRDEPNNDQIAADKEAGVLDRASCLAALAALRHTKWFQAMAHGLPSCAIAMRVLKDICRRVPAWGTLDSWMLELLVQKSIVSATPDFTRPGDVFRRVMECVASGVFLPGGNGLLDPCEKGKVDAAGSLTAQDRANITLSAQHALRLIAFEKLHLVLGVEPLPAPSTPKAGTKRRAEEEEQSEETEAKKAKLTPEPSATTT